MYSQADITFPLQNAFLEIMRVEKDMPHKGVDLSSYLLLIDTLKNGYGLNSREELLFLCKKLWLKPFHLRSNIMNEQVLEEILDRHLGIYTQQDFLLPADKKTTEREATKGIGKDEGTKKPLTAHGKEDVSNDQGSSQTTETLADEEVGELNFYISEVKDDTGATTADHNYNHLFRKKNYTFDNRYLPVSRRFIEQTIRSLRYKVPGAGRPTVDIPATVEEVARKGYFDEWKLTEEDGFVTRWTLLIDHEGSMVAFKDLTDAIVESATTGNVKNEGDVFYFRNYPSEYLFTNPEHTRSVKLRKLITSPPRNILIVSDAGAARGYYSEDRVRKVFRLLYQLRSHRIAWLNPLPEQRWKGTSAEKISTYVKMFEPGNDNSDHMGNIIQFFKTKGITNIGQ
ncbi:hypothetical protein [Chitinophaga ginsengisoli]|uniref:VWA containing CoxE family protein n=1 Tax=Chitinophaga ginsengisoli TaxID=363837 RepID=A0A2P8G114_9BACT|nr:hypothetical protein [Chitinophaga ginsengisoli]PSL27672.1 hypothetical protein CLV42_109209 [Chitinophaga ginsengisoli]